MKVLKAIAALTMQFLVGVTGIISPAMEGLAQHFSDVPFTTVLLLGSLPSLLAIPAALATGAVAGRKISFRALTMMACALLAVGGAAPYLFQNSFAATLACRAVFGIGYGIVIALMGTLIVRLYDGEERAKMLGAGSIVLALGGIVMSFVAGLVITVSLPLMWLVHLVAVLCFLACLFWLPEPEKVRQAADTEDTTKTEKVRFPAVAWELIVGYALGTLASYVLFLIGSTIIVGEGLGSAATAGLLISVYFVGGFLGGLIFGRYCRLTGRFVIAFANLITAAGIALVAFSGAVPVIMLGSCLVGLGYTGLIIPGTYLRLGQFLPAAGMAVAGGFVGAAGNIAGFLTPYWIKLANTVSGNPSPRAACWAGAILYLVLTVFFLFRSPSAEPAPE